MSDAVPQTSAAAPASRRTWTSPGFAAIPALLTVLAAVPVCAAPTSLGDCIALALASSPAMRGSAAEIRAAHERVSAARAAYVPRLSARAEYGHAWGFNEAITDGGRTAALLTLELPVFDGGQRGAEVDAARARFRSAKAMERLRRADVALTVRTAYWAALSGRSEAQIQTAAAVELDDYLSLLQRQEDRGLVLRDDVIRAQSAQEAVQSARRASEAVAAAALRELRLLTGVQLVLADLIEPELESLEPPSEQSIDSSPPLADARAQAAAAHRDVDAARSEYWGRLGFVGNGGFLGINPGETFHENGGGDFLFGFAVPIFDGGAIGARVAAAEAVAASLDAKVAEVRQVIDIALLRVQADATRAAADMAAWQRSAPRAAEGFSLVRARYFGGGNVRLLEVLDSLAQSVEARVAADRARLAYEAALATQDHILGVDA